MKMLKDASILITGGTGSFGQRLVRTLLDETAVARIIIFSRDEQKHFLMQEELKNDHRLRFFLGDVRDKDRLFLAMKDVDYIVHAAAMKHVPLAEYNPIECLKTNVHGAENVIEAALRTGVKKVVALSTDKAANPINLYGASKLASDKLFSAANAYSGADGAKFSVVRYGNVVASKGSVVPFFERKIAEGCKALPITDVRMTRFWITLQQGVDFVLKAFQRMQGGELFVPKIPSVKIVDLARAIAPKMPHDIVGIRPGEKLHEIMCPSDDSHLTLEFHDHFVIKPTINFGKKGDFAVNLLGEMGKPVEQDFEYRSDNNSRFLTTEEILFYNEWALTNRRFEPVNNEDVVSDRPRASAAS
jgi:UDP-N-acetylglucosamine 4,6-dehydratase/5-epimerase